MADADDEGESDPGSEELDADIPDVDGSHDNAMTGTSHTQSPGKKKRKKKKRKRSLPKVHENTKEDKPEEVGII